MMDPQEPDSLKQQEEEQSMETSESQDPPLLTGDKEELPPTTSNDKEDQEQKVAENKNESSTELAEPSSKPKEILNIPTVSAPKVLCVPFSASDEDSPVSPVTNSEDSKTTPSVETVKKSTIIVPKQTKKVASQSSKDIPSKKPVPPQSGIIQFSNPQGNGGSGQKIKIDISQTITPILAVAMTKEPPEKVSEEDGTEKVEEIALQCDEKMADSPELEKKASARVSSLVANVGSEQQCKPVELVEDLLKPLSTPELPTEIKPGLSFGMNEFGLYEINKQKPRDVSVAASPRKDTSAVKRIQDDNILMCEGCGCYGMAGEFVAQNSCSPTCSRLIMEKLRDKQRKEREVAKLKQKREAKNGKKNSVQSSREMSVPKTTHYNESYPWQDTNGFNWQKYLEWSSSKAAPVTFFKSNPFPKPHQFIKGMKLEAIDPQTPSMICVVSIVEILGPRLRLHFDGYSDTYDFWENVNSENLFPVGWCEKNDQCLVPPKGLPNTTQKPTRLKCFF